MGGKSRYCFFTETSKKIIAERAFLRSTFIPKSENCEMKFWLPYGGDVIWTRRDGHSKGGRGCGGGRRGGSPLSTL